MPDPVSYIPSFAELLLETIDPQFKQPVNILVLQAIGYAMQELEDIILDAQVGTMLGVAEGTHLRQYGDVVDEAQLSLSDPRYRAVIRSKVRALKSGGNILELVKVFKRLLSAEVGGYTTALPAGYRLHAAPEYENLDDAMAERVVRIMDLMRTAGYAADYVELPVGGGFQLDTAGAGLDSLGMGRRLNDDPATPDPGPDRLVSGFSDGFSAGFR